MSMADISDEAYEDEIAELKSENTKALVSLGTAFDENTKLRTALEKIKEHDTHNLHNNRGNAYQMAEIAKQALKENDNG